LVHKCSFLRLLDLYPKEELQLAHHAHLKFPALPLQILQQES
jgi:hypothetical protein